MKQRWLARLPENRQNQVRLWGQRLVLWGALALFVFFGTFSIALDKIISSDDTLTLEAGDVAPRDVLAPRSLIFDSPVLTEQARQEAINRVQPAYDPNPDVNRQQIRLAQQIIIFVAEIRHDIYGTIEQRVDDLHHIESLTLTDEQWSAILALSDIRWEPVSAEIVSLVERIMQRDIRPDNLESTRNSLVNNVATRFSDQEASLIVAVAQDLVQPNSFYNQELTEARQASAAEKVVQQERRFEQGQLIVRSGNLTSELDMEALRKFDLLDTGGVRVQAIIGACLAMMLVTILFGAYLERFTPNILNDPPMLALLAILFLLSLFIMNLFGDNFANQPYLYPSAALALLLTTLTGPQLAITVSVFLAVLIGLMQPEDRTLEMAAYVVVGSLFGVLAMRRVERLNSYFTAGVIIGVGNVLVVLAFLMLNTDTPSLPEALFYMSLAFINGLFSGGLALVGLYVITSVMNLPTNLKMIELTDPKQALLQQLLRQAPGTYQHSLQVANLSELAAEAINADTQLVRVAAMYHDIGKMLNPYYFVENTTEGMNPHEDLNDPVQSARVIIGHVTEGDKMARRTNLPSRIRDFILEHHGTTQVSYFYQKAIEQADGDESQVNIDDFTYPGPIPRSRETAIMMLADGCESATRSRRPSTKDDIEDVVNTIFELRLGSGQLDDSGLTLNDLKLIRHTFIETLQAMYHPRIAYQTPKPRLDDKRQSQMMSGIIKQLGSNLTDKRPSTEAAAVQSETLNEAVVEDEITPHEEPLTLARSRSDIEALSEEEILDTIEADESHE